MKYRLRLSIDGSWELYDEGHITCAGRKWDHSMATHLRQLLLERDGGLPIMSRPPTTSSEPVSIDTFLAKMASS